MMSKPECPGCGKPLQNVGRGPGWMNSEQWDAVKAGDWHCPTCPSNGRGESGAYFFDNELPLSPEQEVQRMAKIALAEFTSHMHKVVIPKLLEDRRKRAANVEQARGRLLAARAGVKADG